ncbi:unnamed protein product [Lupinus luteus]|uniref:Uncharacterized protein n=1 Tax=Lupinus luteus TaxID=3873 RepID=A0AAV1Y5M4_LUPLU
MKLVLGNFILLCSLEFKRRQEKANELQTSILQSHSARKKANVFLSEFEFYVLSIVHERRQSVSGHGEGNAKHFGLTLTGMGNNEMTR